MAYILDTSIWIHLVKNHPPDIFVNFWRQLDASITAGDVRSPEEVLHELERGTDDVSQILRRRSVLFVPLEARLQAEVRTVMEACPGLADPDAERNRADPFVVALAQLRRGTVVTMERPRRAPTAPPKIPDACVQLGVPWRDWFGFLRLIGWQL